MQHIITGSRARGLQELQAVSSDPIKADSNQPPPLSPEVTPPAFLGKCFHDMADPR